MSGSNLLYDTFKALRSVTWNRFPIKNFVDRLTCVSFVEIVISACPSMLFSSVFVYPYLCVALCIHLRWYTACYHNTINEY